LAERYSAKWVYGIATGFSAMLGLLSPTMAKIDIGLLVAVRALQGAFQGCSNPAMFVMSAKWLPRQERARLFSLMQAGKTVYQMILPEHLLNVHYYLTIIVDVGSQFGTFLSLPACSLVSHYFGWEYIFYVFGGLSIVWFVLWVFLAFESPEDHPRISKVRFVYFCDIL
jgi:MFS family permease